MATYPEVVSTLALGISVVAAWLSVRNDRRQSAAEARAAAEHARNRVRFEVDSVRNAYDDVEVRLRHVGTERAGFVAVDPGSVSDLAMSNSGLLLPVNVAPGASTLFRYERPRHAGVRNIVITWQYPVAGMQTISIAEPPHPDTERR